MNKNRNFLLRLTGCIGFALFSVALTGCSTSQESVKIGDPKLKPFRAMYHVNRQKLGFTPLPQQADVTIETRAGSDAVKAGYDVMLHIYANTERTVNFKESGNSYVWTGEQETHTGPGTYTTPDGTFSEQITITYETFPVAVQGFPTHKTYVSYNGENPKLSSKFDLTLKDVQPTLKDWQ